MQTKNKSNAPRQGGPKTDAGKAKSAMNAVKTGLHVSGWLDDQEQSEYEALFDQLCTEYQAQSPTMLIQIERMAGTMVKMRRLQKIEAALFIKARQIAHRQSQEKAQALTSRDEASGVESTNSEMGSEIAQLSAMPDMDRLATLQKYQTSLDRQLSKIIGEIRILNSQAMLSQTSSQQTMPRVIAPADYRVSSIDDV